MRTFFAQVETRYRAIKVNNYDRNINIIRLLVPIHTSNRLCRKTETKQ